MLCNIRLNLFFLQIIGKHYLKDLGSETVVNRTRDPNVCEFCVLHCFHKCHSGPSVLS